MTISIVLADDHTVLRQGLHALLEIEPDFTVVGEAGSGLEALKLVEKLRPDVLVLDLFMPGLGGLEVIRQLAGQHSPVHIVVLSMHEKEAYVLEALKNGAKAYVRKGAEASELRQAIREAAQGRRYLSPPLSEWAIDAYIQQTTSQLDPYETLTNRERLVFQLSAEGLNNTDIAKRLDISPRTVEVHRAKAMSKLNLDNQADLIRYAIRHGILTLEE
jgi:two-component system, NarL family, response regulator NreC